MARFRNVRRAAALAGLAALAAAPAAKADLIAAYERLVPGNGYDIAMVNLSTLQPIAVPAGINTTADEFHPSLTADGRRLTFERVTPPILSQPPAPGTTVTPAARQILVFDRTLRTEVQPPVLGNGDTVKGAPGIAADGSRVIHGTAGDPNIAARVTITNLASPFAQTTLATPPGTLLGQSTVTPAIGTGSQPLVAWSTRRISTQTTTNGDILVPSSRETVITQTQDLHVLRFRPDFTGAPEVIRTLAGTDTVAFAHPAIAAVGPFGLRDVTAFERLDIVTRSSTSCFFTCSTTTTRLPGQGQILVINSLGQGLVPAPAAINTALDERLPAWSGDGRYLAFVRAEAIPLGPERSEVRNRIHVFDFQTQSLVQGMVFDIGRPETSAPSVGNLTVAQPPEFRIVCDLACQRAIAESNPLSPTQTRSGTVGIIVQRVTGFRRLLGRRVPRLQFVGRVPFGRQRAGRLRIDWDRRVNGRPLPPGRYLVTFRSLNAEGAVRELARPATLIIPRRR